MHKVGPMCGLKMEFVAYLPLYVLVNAMAKVYPTYS